MLPRQIPRGVPAVALNFGQLVAAKINLDDAPPRIILMIESYRTEKKKIDALVPQLKTVVQTYTTADGKKAEREVTVNQMITVQIEQDILVPAGLKPTVMDLADFEFFDLDSQPVSHESAAQKLNMLFPVFLIEMFQGEMHPIGKYEKEVLKSDVLIATTPKPVRPMGQQGWQPAGDPAFQFPPPQLGPQAVQLTPVFGPQAMDQVPGLAPPVAPDASVSKGQGAAKAKLKENAGANE